MRMYLAAPFFNEDQRYKESKVRNLLRTSSAALGIVDVYAPYEHGVLWPDAPPARKSEVFNANIEAIDKADVLVAVLDDKDPGTLFELGYAFGRYKNIWIVYVVPTVKINVMLSMSAIHTFNGIDKLIRFLNTGIEPPHSEEATE